jgi:CheY-like chemotaxis protein
MNKPLKVLLADDETGVQKMVSRRLVSQGYEVILADDGEQALRLAREKLPDIIVMDVMMPKMNGDEVASELKNDARTAEIPIIFLTCLVKADEAWQSHFVVGNNPMLPKPLDSVRLVSMIESLTAA